MLGPLVKDIEDFERDLHRALVESGYAPLQEYVGRYDMSDTFSDEVEAGADALRRLEQSGRVLRLWDELPKSTRKKWKAKVLTVLGAIQREKARRDAITGSAP